MPKGDLKARKTLRIFYFTPVKKLFQKNQRTISLTIFELSFSLQFSREIQKLVERSEAALIQVRWNMYFFAWKTRMETGQKWDQKWRLALWTKRFSLCPRFLVQAPPQTLQRWVYSDNCQANLTMENFVCRILPVCRAWNSWNVD